MEDIERKDLRRKSLKNKKQKNNNNEFEDFSYSKIKNQFKQKKQYLKDKDTIEELENFN